MLISNCARCGQLVEETLKMPIFHIATSQVNKTNKGKVRFRTVVLCDECQDQLWKWIYCENGDETK